ncbi:hypothetical protein ACFQRD_00745 [Brachybacterium sp. GCM10030268]|uniref:hypothetical protein n=1 Tax=Brachybacterium sp. GCM10030268 TaxID=3273382 RepID=UPI0036134E54
MLVVELGATIGTVTGRPFAPVDGWGPTRPADVLAFALVILGSLVLAAYPRFPLAVSTIATASYIVFALRDHELGMFLPPMVVALTLAARPARRLRLAAIACAGASLAAGLVWVSHRAEPIEEPGVALLVRVAFGVVLAVFFLAPLLLGEIVRLRSAARCLARTGPRSAPAH